MYNELEDGTRKIAMRSVDSILDELPYSGWEVEAGGTFVEDLQITLHGRNFFFFGVVHQLFSNCQHLPTPTPQAPTPSVTDMMCKQTLDWVF